MLGLVLAWLVALQLLAGLVAAAVVCSASFSAVGPELRFSLLRGGLLQPLTLL